LVLDAGSAQSRAAAPDRLALVRRVAGRLWHRGRPRRRTAVPPADARERVVRAESRGRGARDHAGARKRRITAMTSWWTPLVASLVLLAACDAAPGRPAKSSETVAPDEVVDFRVLYGANCAGCHGEQGRGGAAIGLADPVYLAIADDTSIRRVTTNGVSGTAM